MVGNLLELTVEFLGGVKPVDADTPDKGIPFPFSGADSRNSFLRFLFVCPRSCGIVDKPEAPQCNLVHYINTHHHVGSYILKLKKRVYVLFIILEYENTFHMK